MTLPLFMIPEPVAAVGACAKATLVLTMAWAAATSLARRAAAVRHLVWSAAVVGALALVASVPIAPRFPLQVPLRGVSVEALTTWLEIASTAWAVGAALVASWTLAGYVAMARAVSRARPSVASELTSDPGLAGGRARGANDGILWSAEIAAPLACGLLHPVILLPIAAGTWPPERLRAAILHERAHIARGDYLLQALANLACVVLWFHPLVWYGARRMRRESEGACDERVVLSGMPAHEYAGHLIAVAREAWSRPAAFPAAGMAARSDLVSRVAAILDDPRARRAVPRRTAALVLALFTLLVASLACLRTQIDIHEPPGTAAHHGTR